MQDPQPGLSAIDCPASPLAPTDSETCTATYTTTQGDVDRGSITNTGTASGTPPTGAPVTDQATLTIPGTQNPGLTMVKSASPSSFSATGATITYSYLVTNSGNVTLTSIQVTDPLPDLSPVTCPISPLAPGSSETCTATYITTQADLDRGSITNSAIASGIPPSGPPPTTTPSSATVPAVQNPSIGLVKSASVSSYNAAGQDIIYRYLVTNTGNVTLSSIAVADPMTGLSAISCPASSLLPGVFETCIATYTTTQADENNGSIDNTGTASGTPPTGASVTATSALSIPGVQNPAITIAKSADVSTYSGAGTGIIYSYLVTNTGNVTLNPVTVTDPLPGLSAIICPDTSILPGGSENCTATYTTTQADVDNGSITNTGTATGTPPTGPPVSATSSVTITAAATPAITIAKAASVGSFSAAGLPVTYSYLLTNSGNVTLGSIAVTDPMTGLSAVTCPEASLAPAISETCTATYTTTQADVDRGSITNTGTASGTPPTGSAVTATSSVTIPAVQAPAIGIVKSASPTSFSAPGTPITYSYLVTNSGNVTLGLVGVSDPMPGLSTIACPLATLIVGASETCAASYVTTQADVDNGSISNTGTATGTAPGNLVVSAESSSTVTAVQSPAITLVKSSDTPSYSAPGNVINYHYLVTNSGNVTLSQVTVNDPLSGLTTVNCHGVSSLAPGAFVTCDASYTVTQADVDAGSVTNNATASGTPPAAAPVADESSVTVDALQSPAIAIVKSASPTSYSQPGVPLTFTYTVTNPGNVDLSGVMVTDPQAGLSPLACQSVTQLAPGAIEVCTATYTTTQADVDAGKIVNTGTATGTPPSGPQVSDQSTLTTPANLQPAITISKSASISSFAGPGVGVTYSYLVTNSGNLTLNPVTVSDPMPGLSAISCSATSLAPAQAETCTASYTTTQADVDRGSISNTGLATGTPPTGPAVTATSNVVLPAVQNPGISIAKTADLSDFAAANTPIQYSYLVTNTGNVSLNPVTVTDPMPGLSAVNCHGVTSLAPESSEECTASYTTTQADVNAGTLVNTGTATGTPPSGPAVSDASTVTLPAISDPGITVVKSSSPTSYSAVGTVVTYSYLVTNAGNVTLSALDVTDPMLGLSAVNCKGVTSLAPGAQVTCTAAYTTTQADVDAGAIANTGTATATPPTGPPITDSSSLSVPAVQTVAIHVDKSADITSFDAPGVTITYTFVATNIGNVTLANPTVSDPMKGLSSLSCPDLIPGFTLAPGQSLTCTATYTTTQADVDAGGVFNTAVATGTGPQGQSPSDTDTVDVVSVENPAITLVKSANPPDFPGAGTKVTYSYLVTNTGNVTLSPVTVTDPMAGLSAVTCPDTSLAPTDSESCTATYTTTQADVEAGSITNVGTATGTPPTGAADNVTATSTLTIGFDALTLHKSASITSFDKPGQAVNYSYLVTNIGHLLLDPVTVTDPMPGLSAIDCPGPSLAPAASETCTATYTTTQADVDRGSVTNIGTATGKPPTGPLATVTSTLTIPASANPSIGLVKTASVTSFSSAGTVVTYSFKVTNTGNVTLHAIAVTDAMPGLSAIACPASTLAPGASETCTATYTTTSSDVSNGKLTNTATVAGTTPHGALVKSAASTVIIPGPPAPSPVPPSPVPPAPPTPVTPEPIAVTG